jgi:hypothetical protein
MGPAGAQELGQDLLANPASCAVPQAPQDGSRMFFVVHADFKHVFIVAGGHRRK